jgi:hypothetical protein
MNLRHKAALRSATWLAEWNASKSNLKPIVAEMREDVRADPPGTVSVLILTERDIQQSAALAAVVRFAVMIGPDAALELVRELENP